MNYFGINIFQLYYYIDIPYQVSSVFILIVNT
jgi:adenylate cyclase